MATLPEIEEKQETKTKFISVREHKYKIKLKGLLNEYETCFIISKLNVSSQQFGALRKAYHGRARFLFGRNVLIRDIIREYIKETNKNQWSQLLPYIRGQCGLIFTNEKDVATLRKEIEANKRNCFAKAGQISPIDIFVPYGPTQLDPTQTAYMSALNIPTRIRRGKIHIDATVKVVGKGQQIGVTEAAFLSKVNIKPFHFGPKVQYILQDGELFDAKILDITDRDIELSFFNAIQRVASLCVILKYPTIINVGYSVLNAYKTVLALGLELSTYTWVQLDEIRDILENGGYIQHEKQKESMFAAELKEEEESVTSSSKVAVALFGDDDSSSDADDIDGAEDVNNLINFRQCIEQNIMPSIRSVTYNSLLYEYYFDTTTRQSVIQNDTTDDIKDNNDNKDDGSTLFYPTYCYAKVQKMDFINNVKSDNEFEYYMSVGMNSNINNTEFKRKHLNLVILLDISGSMGSQFSYGTKTKMNIATESCITLLKHLTPKDRIGVVTFESEPKIEQTLEFVNDINMSELKKTILGIKERGGVNVECGYNKTIEIFQKLFKQSDYALNTNVMDIEYDNRIILITNGQLNQKNISNGDLLSMVAKYANNENMSDCIFTTFINVGLDFNSSLIETISQIRGCNYYSVQSAEEFKQTMDDDLEYMVTPLVFNVCLRLKCEGHSCEIENVYGYKDDQTEKIIKTGEIKRIYTLFPTKKTKTKSETQGGIQLIMFRKKNNKNDDDNINVEIVVSFEDRNGKLYKNTQFVTFEPPKLPKYESVSFYDNNGIRKAILLCKYIELMLDWINMNKTENLNMNEKYKQIFEKFLVHFKNEMIKCKDDDLKKEVNVIQKLLKL